MHLREEYTAILVAYSMLQITQVAVPSSSLESLATSESGRCTAPFLLFFKMVGSALRRQNLLYMSSLKSYFLLILVISLKPQEE